jgi:hypothetical protein
LSDCQRVLLPNFSSMLDDMVDDQDHVGRDRRGLSVT